MSTPLPCVLGDLAFSGTLGWENNELHRKVFLANPGTQLRGLLTALFGGGGTPPQPMPFSQSDGTLNSFYAWSINFESQDKAVQNSSNPEAGNFDFLLQFPTFKPGSGLTLDICYRPMAVQSGATSGITFTKIDDEVWDYTSQVMSLVGNAYSSNTTTGSPIVWQNSFLSGGGRAPVTNLHTIVKLVPKIEIMLKTVYHTSLPPPTISSLIGSVNSSPVAIDGVQFQPETLLAVGLPALRRWRWDGTPVYEIGIKLAANMTQGLTADAGQTFVGWNRLFNPVASSSPWDRIVLSASGQLLYPQGDLNTWVQGF